VTPPGVDVDGLIKNVLKGAAVPSHSWFWPNSCPDEPDVTTYTYDPDKAEQLLAQAGHPNGLPSSTSCQDRAQVLRQANRPLLFRQTDKSRPTGLGKRDA
jgi:ABC-type transport system substrate-binding protein